MAVRQRHPARPPRARRHRPDRRAARSSGRRPPEAPGRQHRAVLWPARSGGCVMAVEMGFDKPPRYAQVNGIRVAYDLAGDGYPLIALHGFPRNRKVWRKLTPLLTSRFAVAAPDRRGYGDSDRPADPSEYDNAHMVRDTLELADHLGWQQFVVIGHDKGAPTAQRLAMDHPDRVRGLVMLDATPSGSRPIGPRDTTGRSWYFDFFRQRGVAEQLIGQNPRLFFSLFLDRNPH